MKQSRYYSAHHDSPPDERTVPSPSGALNTRSPTHSKPSGASRVNHRSGLPEFVRAGPQAGDQACLRFLAPRKLRRLDIEGPSSLVLSINGRSIGHVRPGENIFDPPVALQAGDTLQLEAVEHDDVPDAPSLTGRSSSSAAADLDVSAGTEVRHD